MPVEMAALIPIKGFHAAKARLAPVLSERDRERLARWMATRVVDALRPMPTFVACDDERVADWADGARRRSALGPRSRVSTARSTSASTRSPARAPSTC